MDSNVVAGTVPGVDQGAPQEASLRGSIKDAASSAAKLALRTSEQATAAAGAAAKFAWTRADILAAGRKRDQEDEDDAQWAEIYFGTRHAECQMYQLYRAVLISRGEFDPNRRHKEADLADVDDTSADDDGIDDAELSMRQDLDACPPKACYYRDWWRDWKIYIANNHPFIAMFLSYDTHVVSRNERWYINMVLIVLTLSLSAVAAETESCITYFSDACNNIQLINGTTTQVPDHEFCCTIEAFGFVGIYDSFGPTVLALYISVLGLLVDIFLMQCAACSTGPTQQLSDEWRYGIEKFGHLILFVGGILSFLLYFMSGSGKYVHQNNLYGDMAQSFVTSKIGSYFGTLAGHTAVFALLWRNQSMPAAEGRCCDQAFNLHWDDPHVLEYMRRVEQYTGEDEDATPASNDDAAEVALEANAV